MKNTMLWTVLVVTAGLTPLAQATAESKSDAQPQKEASPWRGERAIGFNRSTGNSSVENLLGKIRLFRKNDAWDIDMKAEAIVSSNKERKTRQRVIADIQTGFNFADTGYSFANLRYTDDRFGPFTSQASLSAGVGWRPFSSDRKKLSFEGGLGMRHSERRVSEETNSETVLRGKMDWQYQLTETTTLLNNLRVVSGPENTLMESETAMRLKINSDMGLKLSYRLRNNSQVPVGSAATDTLTALSLEFLF